MSRGRNLLVVVLLASTCAAAKRLPVRFYTTSDGLALDGVGCIVQDSRGFPGSVRRRGLRLEADIEDNGRGFNPPSPERPDVRAGGNGLGNMRLRAAQLGGRLDIDSAPSRGTRLKLTVPLR
jgi:hypothetical protein